MTHSRWDRRMLLLLKSSMVDYSMKGKMKTYDITHRSGEMTFNEDPNLLWWNKLPQDFKSNDFCICTQP